MPHEIGHQRETGREPSVITGDPITDAILQGRNTEEAIRLLNRLVSEGVIDEDSYDRLFRFILQNRAFRSGEERLERISGGRELRTQQEIARGRQGFGSIDALRQLAAGQGKQPQDILDALSSQPGREVSPEELRRRSFRTPDIPPVPGLGGISREFLGGIATPNLRRFAERQIPGLTSEFLSPEFFQRRREGFESVFGFKGPEERKFRGSTAGQAATKRQTAFFDPESIRTSFRGMLERFPFLEQFMAQAPLQRGREAKRFAPRTRFLRF